MAGRTTSTSRPRTVGGWRGSWSPTGMTTPALEVWDSATGRLIHRHALGLPDAVNVEDWLPNGNSVIVRAGGAWVSLADVETGRLGPPIPADERLAIASDGRLAATWRDRHKDGERHACVWDLATGSEILGVPTGESVHQAIGVAAVARALVIADGRSLRVVDTVTGKDRGRWALPGPGARLSRRPPSVACNSSSRRPAGNHSASGRHGPRLGPTAFPPPPLAEQHGEPEMRAWWDDLAGADARKAYASGWKLSEAPAADVVAFLRAGSGRPRPSTPARFASGSPTSTVPPLPPARRPAGGWTGTRARFTHLRCDAHAVRGSGVLDTRGRGQAPSAQHLDSDQRRL